MGIWATKLNKIELESMFDQQHIMEDERLISDATKKDRYGHREQTSRFKAAGRVALPGPCHQGEREARRVRCLRRDGDKTPFRVEFKGMRKCSHWRSRQVRWRERGDRVHARIRRRERSTRVQLPQ